MSPVSEEHGQYLVEFALAFTVFILFILFVIDIGLVIYNHNLFYRGVSIGAREASLGASNDQIEQAVGSYVEDRYFPGVFSVAIPPNGVQINPPDEIDRVDGANVTVIMDSRFGISIFQFLPLTVELPIRSGELIVQENDRDRDGRKDSLESDPGDHDNDGIQDEFQFDGSDTDPDGDANAWHSDTIAIGYFDSSGTSSCDGYAFYRPNDSPASADLCSYQGNTWDQAFDGEYHAPELWNDGSIALPMLFSRRLPRWNVDNSTRTEIVRELQTAYDRDNDGWEDKYDEAPNDPLVH